MKKERKEKRIILFLLLGVVLMTVGFAAYSGVLNIDGTVNIQSNKWSIGFDAATYEEATGSVVANKTIKADEFVFETNLSKPNQFYQATVDVKNDGTFDAQVTGINIAAVITDEDGAAVSAEDYEKYLTYTVTYDGQEYSGANSDLTLALNTGDAKELMVKVTYLNPGPDGLPKKDISFKLTGQLTYAIAANAISE